MEMSPRMQNQLVQYQQMQQQLQMVMNQRIQAETRFQEIERTLDELSKAGDDPTVYQSVGAILIKAKDPDSIKSKLEDQKETTEVRLKKFKKQEESLKEKFEKLQKKLTEEFQTENVS